MAATLPSQDDRILADRREHGDGTPGATVHDSKAVLVVPGEIEAGRIPKDRRPVDRVDDLQAILGIGCKKPARWREARNLARPIGELGAARLVDQPIAAVEDLNDAPAGRRENAALGFLGGEIANDDLWRTGRLDTHAGGTAAGLRIDLVAAIMANHRPADRERPGFERHHRHIARTRDATPVIGNDGAGLVGEAADAEGCLGIRQQWIEAITVKAHRLVEGDHQIGGVAAGKGTTLPVNGKALSGGDAIASHIDGRGGRQLRHADLCVGIATCRLSRSRGGKRQSNGETEKLRTQAHDIPHSRTPDPPRLANMASTKTPPPGYTAKRGKERCAERRVAGRVQATRRAGYHLCSPAMARHGARLRKIKPPMPLLDSGGCLKRALVE